MARIALESDVLICYNSKHGVAANSRGLRPLFCWLTLAKLSALVAGQQSNA